MADLKLKVYSQDGKEVSTVSVSKDVFGIEPHNQSMFDAVMTYQANLRQATAKTKKRFDQSLFLVIINICFLLGFFYRNICHGLLTHNITFVNIVTFL